MAKGGEQTLLRMQCGVCKTMLACDFERRRKPMVCPMCNRLAPLVYIPPGDQTGGKPIHELPVAKHPGAARTVLPRLLSPVFWFFTGFLACVVLYSLDFGKPLDRLVRRIVIAIQEEFGGTAAPEEATAAMAPSSPRTAPRRKEDASAVNASSVSRRSASDPLRSREGGDEVF